MTNLRPFQVFFTVFYIFGLTSLISVSNRRKMRFKFAIHLQRVVIISTIFIRYFIYLKINENVSKSFRMFGAFLFLFENGLNLIAIVENLFNMHSMNQILESVSFVIKTLKFSLEMHFPFKIMKKSLKRITFILFVIMFERLCMTIYMNSFFNPINIKNIFLVYTILVFEGTKFVNLTYFIFYIEFMSLALATLNQKFALLMSEKEIYWHHGINNKLLKVLQFTQVIHLRICCISQRSNSLFGWFLIAFTINVMIKVIFAVYQLAESLYGNEISVWRKYTFCDLFFLIRFLLHEEKLSV